MKFNSKLIFVQGAGLLIASAEARVCRALAMSGGGSNGAWEAGVLFGFAMTGNPEDFYYDVISGISAGSVNTAGLAGFAPEEFVEAATFLSDTWNTLTNDQIWWYQPDIAPVDGEGVRWDLGVNGFVNYSSVLNDYPALQTIRSILDGFPEGYKRDIIVSAANVQTGVFTEFTNKNTPWSELHYAAMSSASIPVMFPPMHWNGQIYMDGGTVWNLNVDGAVKACMAKGFAENEIIVDMLSCYPRNVKQEASVSDNALQNYLENRDLNKFYHGTRDTYAQLQAYPEVNFRYYVSNNAPALGLDEINFDTIVTWPLQQNGMAQGAAALAAGPGVAFAALRDWEENKNSVKDRFQSFAHYYDAVMTI